MWKKIKLQSKTRYILINVVNCQDETGRWQDGVDHSTTDRAPRPRQRAEPTHGSACPRWTSLVYFRLWAGYFRTRQLLSNQTANEGGRGGSRQEQTACPLSFNPIPSSSSCSLSGSFTTFPTEVLQTSRLRNTDLTNQRVHNAVKESSTLHPRSPRWD